MRPFPKLFSGGEIQRAFDAIAASVEDGFFVDENAWTEVVFDKFSFSLGFALPARCTGFGIKTHHAFAIKIDDGFAIGAEGDGSDDRIHFPESGPGIGMDGHDHAGLAIPFVFILDAALVTLEFWGVIVDGPLAGVDQEEERVVCVQNLLGSLGLGKLAQGFTGGSLQAGDGPFEFGGDEEAVFVADEASSELCGARFQWPHVIGPFWDRAFPEDRAIVSIACDEVPLRGEEDRDARSFIHDVEEPPVRGHFR